jgi:exonuclease III
VRIAAWNAQTLNDPIDANPEMKGFPSPDNYPAKALELTRELQRYRVAIAGISETHWPGQGEKRINGFQFLYSGRNDNVRRDGVALVLSKEASRALKYHQAISERIIVARFKSQHGYVTVIQTYAPIDNASDVLKDDFYDKLQAAVTKTPRSDMLIVMGDLNASVGRNHASNKGVIGHEGLPGLNRNGQRLLDFCALNGLVITTTLFKRRTEHKYTWYHPNGIDAKMIDHIMVNQRFKTSCLNTRSYRGFNVDSDHVPVMSDIRLKLSRNRARNRNRISFDLEKLALSDISSHFSSTLSQKCSDSRAFDEPHNLQNILCSLRDTLIDTARHVIGERKGQRKPWLTDAAFDAIKRKSDAYMCWKNRPTSVTRALYQEARKAAKRAVLESKRRWWDVFSKELESESRTNKLASLYAKIRFLQRSPRTATGCVLDKHGNVIQTDHGRCERWLGYFHELLNVPCQISADVLSAMSNELVANEPVTMTNDDLPTIDEVRGALMQLANRKAPGMDGIPVELLKHGGDVAIHWLHVMICIVWQTERAPQEWKEAAIVPLYKKGDPRVCDNYRGISLLNVFGKVYARLLLNRISGHVEQKLLENQCGFRPARSCADHIFSMRQLMEKAREWRRPIYICFVDLRKAYDSINRVALWKIVKHYGISEKLCNLLADLHSDTRCRVRVDGNYSRWFDVQNGVRQGCVLAPTLFNIFIDFVVRVALKNYHPSGVEIRYRLRDSVVWHTIPNITNSLAFRNSQEGWIHTLLYADDISLVSHDFNDLTAMIMSLEAATQKYGMCVNVEKTVLMAHIPPSVNPAPPPPAPIVLRGSTLSCVSKFRYLGSILSHDCELIAEITQRIASASRVFYSLYDCLWKNRLGISLATKIRIYETVVLPILLYACETWPIPNELLQRLHVFHMRCLRIILGVNIMDRVPNAEILAQTKQKAIATILRTRRLVWFGHCYRMHESRIPRQVLFSCLAEGSRDRGRPSLRWVDLLSPALPANWRTLTKNRDKWRDYAYGR